MATISGCPTSDIEAPASWNVQGVYDAGESFVSWGWTRDGVAVTIPDVSDPGFGAVGQPAGAYVGTLTYTDASGAPQTVSCSFNVVNEIFGDLDGCPAEDVPLGIPVTLTAMHTLTGTVSCTHTVNGSLQSSSGDQITLPNNVAGAVSVIIRCCSNEEPEFQTQITDLDADQSPGVPLPPRCVPIPHPDGSDTCLVRMTEGYTANSEGLQYARRTAITSDGCYILLNGDVLFGPNSANCGQVKCTVPLGEFVASCTDPNLFFGRSGSTFYCYDCTTDTNTPIWTSPTGSSVAIGGFEGQQSWDDRVIVLNDGNSIYSVQLNGKNPAQTIGTLPLPANYNWSDVSPEGDCVVVGVSNGDITKYDADLTNPVVLDTGGRTGSYHADLGYDVAGNQVIVFEGIGSATGAASDVAYTILETNDYILTDIILNGGSLSGALHPSGQAKDLIGWWVISGDPSNFSNSPNTYIAGFWLQPGQNQVFDYGSSYSTNQGYVGEPHGSVSPDGSMVAFSTSWGGGNLVYDFVVIAKKAINPACQAFRCNYTVVAEELPPKEAVIQFEEPRPWTDGQSLTQTPGTDSGIDYEASGSNSAIPV